MESILTSIKKLLGIAEEYTHFDDDLVMHINSSLSVLTQLGVGPEQGFAISGADANWTDFVLSNTKLELIKSYVGLKVRLLFDPPSSAAAIESTNRMINEFEFRIQVIAESEVVGS
ncbi:MAG: hypothetical protein RR475_02310 [Clostridia bacterium]